MWVDASNQRCILMVKKRYRLAATISRIPVLYLGQVSRNWIFRHGEIYCSTCLLVDMI